MNYQENLMRQIQTITLLICTACSSVSMAQGFNIDLQIDSEGKVSPETSLPHEWNENWYSEVRFRSTTISTENTSTILTRSATTIDEQYKRVNILGYQQKNERSQFGVAGGAEVVDITRSEFGFGTIASDLVVIDNHVDIQAVRWIVSGFYNKSFDYIDLHTGFNLAPAGQLTVSQDTYINYTSDISVKDSNNSSMDLSYGAEFDVLIKTGTGVDVKIGAEYLYLPLEYDLGVVNNSLTAFETTTITQNETTLRYTAKFILPGYEDKGRPVIGFTQELLTTDTDGESNTETVNYIILGLMKSF